MALPLPKQLKELTNEQRWMQKGVFAATTAVMEHLADAPTGNVQQIAASQIQLLSAYYDLALNQARRSFRWALVASGVGLGFFILAISVLMLDKSGDIAQVSVISGALIEFIAGVNFVLYGRAVGQLSVFHTRLEGTQRFLLANSLCEGLGDELKGQARSQLIAKLADSAVQGGAASSAS